MEFSLVYPFTEEDPPPNVLHAQVLLAALSDAYE